MASDTDLLTIIRDELKKTLAEDTPAEDIEYAAKAIVRALRGILDKINKGE